MLARVDGRSGAGRTADAGDDRTERRKGLREERGLRRKDGLEVGAGRSRHPAREGVDDPVDRLERDALALPAPPEEDDRVVLGGHDLPEMTDQRALAEPGLAGDGDHDAGAAQRLVEGLAQHGELGGAAHEALRSGRRDRGERRSARPGLGVAMGSAEAASRIGGGRTQLRRAAQEIHA